MINIKYANGNWLCIKDEEICEFTIKHLTKICDVSLDAIMELISQYELRNGTYPITVESVRKIFQY